MTCPRILDINIVTLDLGDLKVHPSELDYISHTQVRVLIHRIKLLEYLVHRLFFSDDEPHGFLQVDVVFFVFFGFSCGLRVADHVV